MRLVVLASGRGSNFQAIADACRSGQLPGVSVAALISNNPEAPALRAARERHIATHLVDSRPYLRDKKGGRERYEAELIQAVETFTPDFICLAGYMLLLGRPFIQKWPLRILNIHPSLLPSFKGLHAQRQALEAGARWTGCTVHFVTEALDAGPILEQSVVEILPHDTEETLSERLLGIEHVTYVRALHRLKTQPYYFEGQRLVWSARS